ncbi:MAG: iron-containing alcohol dehydrogenase [Thermoprotei archaeon]|jgi:alcohol dehydrogenase class IV
MWWFVVPSKIAFGEDALDALNELSGKRVLIITDKIIVTLGYVKLIENKLKEHGFDVICFDDVEPEPSTEVVHRALEIANEFKPDWFIAIGGGSSMDTAKAVWTLYERPDKKIEEINPLEPLGLRKKAKFVCIPTTSGTGSESTWAIVITDKENMRKMELASREVLPDLVILDPKLTLSMPPRLTADTGIDALAHSIEAYVSTWRNDYSDALAEKAIELIFKYLPRAYENGNDVEAREKMHYAADMAGMAFSNSQIGIAHALAHAFGAVFRIPHGRSVGLFLPYSIQYNWKYALERYRKLAERAGINKNLDQAVTELLKELEQPTSVKQLNVSEDEYFEKLDLLVSRTMESTGIIANPRPVEEKECKKIFEYAYEGLKIDF